MTFSTGYDMKNEFKFGDGLGKMYTALATLWTVLLACGCIFIIINRKLPFIRMRSVPIVISAVAILHVYWVLCLLAYGLNGFFPCATEFWIMNIYLPIGIALFHLGNTKMLQVAMLQRRYTNIDLATDVKEIFDPSTSTWRKWTHKIKNLGAYERVKWLIGIGMLVQFVCALLVFLASRKFHSTYGLVGGVLSDNPTTKRECRKGWEWIPSVIWQIFWSWIYAPYLLWKVRDIRDTHGWRLQTLICCLAGIPASPMWLLALYLPQMSKVNTYFIPPMWFVPSILLIEAFMIFLPCWHVIQHRRIKNETLQIIAQWEQEKHGISHESGFANKAQPRRRILYKTSACGMNTMRKAHSHMYTMAALEKALQTNPTPLLLFAALKDFSGENISFLNHVRDWKKQWLPSCAVKYHGRASVDSQLWYRQFIKAVGIFSTFVSPRFSDFPINISYSHVRGLETIFHEAASIINAKTPESSNFVTPFDDLDLSTDENDTNRVGDGSSSMASIPFDTISSFTEKGLISHSRESTVINVYRVKEQCDALPQGLPVPAEFNPEVFDRVAESVRYMVLTNTWPRFVDAGYAARTEKDTAIEKIQDRLIEYGIGRSRICSF